MRGSQGWRSQRGRSESLAASCLGLAMCIVGALGWGLFGWIITHWGTK